MATYSDLRDVVVDLLWSQWHELGVSSTVSRRHGDDCIDLEALIAFTAAHGDLDPRLRDESIDWVLRYGIYISKARLKNVLASQGLLEDARVREYAATANAHGGVGWPAGDAQPLTFRPRGRSTLEDLARPALLSLRIRALFGVGARAELIKALIAHPGLALTAADLASETGYGKRNVLNELEPLRFAGLVKSVRAVNADRFRLARAREVTALVGPLPRRFTPWTPTFAALHVVLDLARRAGKRSELANAVDAVRALDERRSLFAAAGIDSPTLPAGAEAWPAFVAWAVAAASALAGAPTRLQIQ